MTKGEIEALMKGIAPVIREYVQQELRALTDAAVDRVAKTIADAQREARLNEERREAEHRALVAERTLQAERLERRIEDANRGGNSNLRAIGG